MLPNTTHVVISRQRSRCKD